MCNEHFTSTSAGCFFLTGTPLNFLSEILHVNGSWFSLGVGGYKGILYLGKLGGFQLDKYPVEEEDDFL